ncbi:MAG: NADH-quinone oxidoreductase subunit J [Planctomycetaceae bacterium]|nr:NADH-quinone oxidoreductase subunit J [Planctomycetaceae bacterium]
MAFWLIVSLGSTAGLFFTLDADFVGATQLLVYVGGTLVLLIFGVMLTASGPFLQIKTSPGEGVLAGVVGAMLFMLILRSACAVDWDIVSPRSPKGGVETGYNPPGEGNSTRALGLSFLGARPDKDLGSHDPRLAPGYLLPFEIVSVHLLVVLIGAAYLARTKRRRPGLPESSPTAIS